LEFEAHVRRLLSTGMSAVEARDCTLMNAEFLLSPEELKKVVVPDVRWMQKQREAMGAESWLHGMMKTCRAEETLQFGFDETMIRRQSTMNQWALIKKTKDSPLEVVSIETAGTLAVLTGVPPDPPFLLPFCLPLARVGGCDICVEVA
jgi:hypothetical protein